MSQVIDLKAKSAEVQEKRRDCVELCEAVYKLALQGKVHSIAMVMVTEPGQWQIGADGKDIDGLHEGSKALTKQLAAMMPPPKKKIIVDG